MQEPEFKIHLLSEDQEHITFIRKICEKQISPKYQLTVKPLCDKDEEVISNHNVQLIVIDFSSLDKPTGDLIMQKFEPFADDTPLIGIFSYLEIQEILTYVKRGIRDFINMPIEEDELLKIFSRFQKSTPSAFSVPPGKIYTFFSFKGGVGNTFVSTNTAISYSRVTRKRTLLWDMALHSDDIPFFLNFRPKQTLTDLLSNLPQMDEAYLKGALPPHASGISILAAPQSLDEIEKISFESLEKLAPKLRERFDAIFIDAGCRFSDALVPLTDASSCIFITTTLELISLRRASRCLDILKKLHYAPEKIKIIVNRYHAKHEALTIKEAKEILKFDFVQFISNDYETASKCVNLGQAVADACPQSRMNQEFKTLASMIEKGFNLPGKPPVPAKTFLKFFQEKK